MCHSFGQGEWARDDDGDGIREVHTNSIEGFWTGLRNFLRRGAAAYVLKQSSAQELIQALRAVVRGRHYLSAPLMECVITGYLQLAQGASQDPLGALSRRERQVLRHAAQGETSVEIAAALSLHPRTVETYRLRLMRKLGLHTQAELIQFAQRQAGLDGDP